MARRSNRASSVVDPRASSTTTTAAVEPSVWWLISITDCSLPAIGLAKPRSAATAERALELGLRHPRAAADVALLRLLVELIPRAPTRALPMAADSSAPPRRDVRPRERGRLPGLAA